MRSSLATRYARALTEVVREPAALGKTADELDSFAKMVRESKPLRDLLLDPSRPRAQKIKVIDALTQSMKASVPTSRIIQLLLEKGRIPILEGVCQEFRRLGEEANNQVSVAVTTAVPLDADQRKKVVTALESFTGKKVRLAEETDPAILGGAKTRIGSVVYDGTVAGRLKKLRKQLIGEE